MAIEADGAQDGHGQRARVEATLNHVSIREEISVDNEGTQIFRINDGRVPLHIECVLLTSGAEHAIRVHSARFDATSITLADGVIVRG